MPIALIFNIQSNVTTKKSYICKQKLGEVTQNTELKTRSDN